MVASGVMMAGMSASGSSIRAISKSFAVVGRGHLEHARPELPLDHGAGRHGDADAGERDLDRPAGQVP